MSEWTKENICTLPNNPEVLVDKNHDYWRVTLAKIEPRRYRVVPMSWNPFLKAMRRSRNASHVGPLTPDETVAWMNKNRLAFRVDIAPPPKCDVCKYEHYRGEKCWCHECQEQSVVEGEGGISGDFYTSRGYEGVDLGEMKCEKCGSGFYH